MTDRARAVLAIVLTLALAAIWIVAGVGLALRR